MPCCQYNALLFLWSKISRDQWPFQVPHSQTLASLIIKLPHPNMSVHSIAPHLLKQTSYFPALKNRFACLDLTHSHITMRCVAVFARKVNFVRVNCLDILSMLSDHAGIARSFISFMFIPLRTSYVLEYNFHPAWTCMIRRKMRLVRSKGNVWLSTSSNFASISPLSGVFNLLCNGEGKEASVKVSD